MSRKIILKVGYVLKKYPRYSETFIVNEILAHEQAGLAIEIFSLMPPSDTHFQDIISRVRAPVHYLECKGIKAEDFWTTLKEVSLCLPDLWEKLTIAATEPYIEVYQAVVLARQVREKGIQHLHAHFATTATSVAKLAAYFAGVPFTFTAHAKDIYHESVSREEFRKKLQDASGAITVSDYNVAYLQQHYGPLANKVKRIYNGLDLEQFKSRVPSLDSARIVAVGRLIEKKGFGDLIDACAILAGKGVFFSCQIIGCGELAEKLQTQIDAHNLNAHVQLLGPRPQQDVIRIIREAAMLVMPCVVGRDGNQDGLPTVLLEAMALGTPTVATDVTGIPEAVIHGRTGLIVQQNNPLNLSEAIALLLSDSELRLRFSVEARQLIEKNFDVHQNTRIQRTFFTTGMVSSAKRQLLPEEV